jgi:predicted nucleotidyltransferase
MPSTVERLTKKGLIRPPYFVESNTMYETVMGSVCYGVSTDVSDFDTLGFCLPPKDMLFPHLAGEIPGFGKQRKKFEVYQQHHVFDKDAMGGAGRTYDLNVYSIVKYFQLCMDNNPNMVDSLFTPQECVLHSTKIGNMVRDQRKLFLHKGSWHKFKGYAYNQLHKMESKDPQPDSKRAALREQFGFDVKFAYHVIRLLGEAEQILLEGDIDLRRNSAQLKAIRRGEISKDEIVHWASEKEKYLERVYEQSTLRYSPDEKAIRKLLLECLEEHYGNLDTCIVNPDAATVALREITEIIDRNRRIA